MAKVRFLGYINLMDDRLEPGTPEPFIREAPRAPRVPLVVASPHSGDWYPPDLVAASDLDLLALRKSEDCFVHEIFGEAPARGAPLLRACFPRAYIDVNREPYELDPEMFADPLPDFVNSRSPRVAAGLGTIARIVAEGEIIYRRPLRFAEAEQRIERYYRPYHAALENLIAETQAEFGFCLLLDAHSMPSPATRTSSRRQGVDIVLGDRMGSSCARRVTETAEAAFRRLGYSVQRNMPYAGGFTTSHYGRPGEGRHCLQIEVNRGLYMDERRLTPKPALHRLRQDMGEIVGLLAQLPLAP